MALFIYNEIGKYGPAIKQSRLSQRSLRWNLEFIIKSYELFFFLNFGPQFILIRKKSQQKVSITIKTHYYVVRNFGDLW